MRVIIDTNVLVSGLISEAGPPAHIVDSILDDEFIPDMSSATLAELEEVLHRPELQRYFRRVDVTIFQFLGGIAQVAPLVRSRASNATNRDEQDCAILELAGVAACARLPCHRRQGFRESALRGRAGHIGVTLCEVFFEAPIC